MPILSVINTAKRVPRKTGWDINDQWRILLQLPSATKTIGLLLSWWLPGETDPMLPVVPITPLERSADGDDRAESLSSELYDYTRLDIHVKFGL